MVKVYRWLFFFIWRDTKEKLIDFIKWVNTRDPNLGLENMRSLQQLNYPNITVKKNPASNATTTIFKKSTDRNVFPKYDSRHPITLKNNLQYSQFLRAKHNHSEHQDFLREAQNLIYLFILFHLYTAP